MSIHSAIRILVISILMPVVASCDKAPETAEPPPLRLVRTLEITPPEEEFWRELPGVVEAAQKAELSFRVSGNLKKMPAKEGDIVKKDQLLARLDDTEYKLQLKSRKAEYDQVSSDYERGKSLVEKGLISRADFDKLKAQEESAKSALDTAKNNLEYTSLRAPFAGRIAKRYVQNFEEVSAKQSIFALQDLSSIAIKVDVPESVMIRVKRSAKPHVNAFFDQIPGKEFPLTLKEVATQPDANSKTYEVTFTMSVVEQYNILPGMSVTVRGKPPESAAFEHDKSITVPAHAVLEDSEGRFVYVVKKTGEGRGVVEKRPVKTGNISSLGLAITSGLEVGDQLITAGMSKMYAGLEVRIQAEKTN